VLVTVLAIPLLGEVPTPLQRGGVLVAVAVAHDGVPRLALSSWLVVVWLTVVNTAAAFTVWNHTMRRLSAMESSLVNNTMLVHVAVLAWVFLGERPGARGILGLVLVAGGVVLVQLQRVGTRQPTSQAHP
jgi:drug/metabolite transporter (DMT)-like permease